DARTMNSKEDFIRLLELMRAELNEGVSVFRAEVRNGFSELAKGIAGTNARLDQANAHLDSTNARLDQTNVRLDASINMMRDFKEDVATRLDGVASYLSSINGNVLRHEERIQSLERRVERLEETG